MDQLLKKIYSLDKSEQADCARHVMLGGGTRGGPVLRRITVRKVWVSLASGYPYQELFRQVYAQLQTAPRRC